MEKELKELEKEFNVVYESENREHVFDQASREEAFELFKEWKKNDIIAENSHPSGLLEDLIDNGSYDIFLIGAIEARDIIKAIKDKKVINLAEAVLSLSYFYYTYNDIHFYIQ